jgi:general secretion pathway protein M
MNQLMAFLNRYNRREQVLILGGGILVIVYILWLAVLNPIQKKRNQLAAANISATQSLGRVEIMAAQIQQAQTQGANTSGENINGLIDSSLRNNGLTMSGFQPGANGEVRVRLDKAAYEPLIQWLYDMEFKNNVSILELSVAATNDVGLVTVNVRLKK